MMVSVQRDQWLYIVLQCLLLSRLLCRNGVFAEMNRHYHMSNLCARERQVHYKRIDGAVVTSEGEENFECTVTFKTNSILQKFMLRFDHLALGCQDHLYIFEGSHALTNHKADLSCQSNQSEVGIIFTHGNFVTLRYVTDNWTYPGNGFRLIITAYQDLSVPCRDFLCLNDRCISNDLLCDGINHCGDNSDETSHALCAGNTKLSAKDTTTKCDNTTSNEQILAIKVMEEEHDMRMKVLKVQLNVEETKLKLYEKILNDIENNKTVTIQLQ